MSMKHAWTVLCLAFAAACASEARWDQSQFPQQPTYDGATATAQVGSTPSSK
jgi:hypothetical protein